jgi:hypothetical protein
MLRPTYPSLRLLLSLEWLLLATAVFMEVILPFQLSWSLLLGVGAIAIFTWLGLQLPIGKLGTRLLYTALEISLIWVPATQWGLSPRSVFLMCLVLVMRSCLIFKRWGQLTVLGLALLSYGTLLLTRPIVREKFKIAVWDWRFSNILLFSLTLVFALLLIGSAKQVRMHCSGEQSTKLPQYDSPIS